MYSFSSARILLVAFSVLIAGVYAPHVYAQDGESKEEVFESVEERVNSFVEDFDDVSEQHFFALYGGHNMIQVVNDVRQQVGGAIKKCGEVNPDLEGALDTRFEEWDDALAAIIEDAQANVDNMIAVQEYAKPRDIRKVFKFADDARASRDDEAKKFPVTSPEACEFLRVKMDETQNSLTRLLEATLVSLPNALINDAPDEDADDADDAGAEAAE